jgi:hypothetical protein
MTRRGSHGQRDRLSSVVKTAGDVASPFGLGKGGLDSAA